MRWQSKLIEMGETQVGNKHTVIFKNTEYLPVIRSIKSTCKCSTPAYKRADNELKVIFVAGKIPVHLQSRGWYIASPQVRIMYEDGTVDVLSFTFKITN